MKTTSEVYRALVLIILVYLEGIKSRINATTSGKQIKVDNTEWYIELNKKIRNLGFEPRILEEGRVFNSIKG